MSEELLRSVAPFELFQFLHGQYKATLQKDAQRKPIREAKVHKLIELWEVDEKLAEAYEKENGEFEKLLAAGGYLLPGGEGTSGYVPKANGMSKNESLGGPVTSEEVMGGAAENEAKEEPSDGTGKGKASGGTLSEKPANLGVISGGMGDINLTTDGTDPVTGGKGSKGMDAPKGLDRMGVDEGRSTDEGE